MFAPFLVFITEEIYQARPWADTTKSLHVQLYPNPDTYAAFGTSFDLYTATVSVVEKVRKAKSEQQKSVKTPVVSVKISGRENDLKLVSVAQDDLAKVLNIVDNNVIYETKDEDLDVVSVELGAE